MYPVGRMILEQMRARRMPPLGIGDTHESHHICWPQDLDIFMELNNGRVLTLYDLGRFALAERVGITRLLRKRRWALAMAGVSVRYRRRVRAFDRFRMTTRTLGHDGRFFYMEQTMWRGDEAVSNLLGRGAITSKDGMIPPQEMGKALGLEDWNPPLPDWVSAWIAAEAERIWPPVDTV